MTIQTDMRMHATGVEQGVLDTIRELEAKPILFEWYPDTSAPCVIGYGVNGNGCSRNGFVSEILVTGLSEKQVEELMGEGIEEDEDEEDMEEEVDDPQIGEAVPGVHKMAFGFYDGSWAGTSPVLLIEDSFLEKVFDGSNPAICCSKLGGNLTDIDGAMNSLGSLPYKSVKTTPIKSDAVATAKEAALHMFKYVEVLLNSINNS